jgi:hypothetical protein
MVGDTGVPRGKVLDEVSHARAIETRQPVIGRILRGPRGRPAFAVRVPAVRGDHVPHVVSAVIEPTAIRDLLFSGNIPAAWAGAVAAKHRLHNSNALSRDRFASTGSSDGQTRLRWADGMQRRGRGYGADEARQLADAQPDKGSDATLH